MKEADRKYIQIKKIMREQYKKMEDNANKKKKLDEKQKNIDLIVNSKLKNKLSIEIIKLDKKYKIWLILLLIYGIGLTITEIKKDFHFRHTCVIMAKYGGKKDPFSAVTWSDNQQQNVISMRCTT